jgi:hypothetical protein
MVCGYLDQFDEEKCVVVLSVAASARGGSAGSAPKNTLKQEEQAAATGIARLVILIPMAEPLVGA